ncbi:MAG: efflux RND transporter periplasmic adaptor subunit [Bacteroidota bacterium]
MRTLLVIAFLSLLGSCGRKGDSIFPARKDLTQAVYASGKIYPVNDYKVFAKLPGYVEKIHVRVGDSVKVGQTLITIRSEVSGKNVEMARNQYELAMKNAGEGSPLLIALQQDIASARTKYELDSANYQRFANLEKENATSKLQLEQARTQFDISKQLWLKAKSNYTATRDRLNTELENARLQFEAQSSNQGDYIIASVVNGRVYDIVPKEGELVGSAMMLMEVGDGASYEVELSVDETDVSFIEKGQDIVYTIDAYRDQLFKGKVLEAYPRINPTNKTSKVVASIQLGSLIRVYSGMSVEANIIIAVKKNALVIPREFLLGSSQVRRKAQNDTVKIQRGAEDLEYIEVLSGIDEHTEIVKP